MLDPGQQPAAGRDPLQYGRAVRSPVNVVSKMHDARLGDRSRGQISADHLVDRREPAGAAVYVSDRVNALLRGEACRGGEPIKHGLQRNGPRSRARARDQGLARPPAIPNAGA